MAEWLGPRLRKKEVWTVGANLLVSSGELTKGGPLGETSIKMVALRAEDQTHILSNMKQAC